MRCANRKSWQKMLAHPSLSLNILGNSFNHTPFSVSPSPAQATDSLFAPVDSKSLCLFSALAWGLMQLLGAHRWVTRNSIFFPFFMTRETKISNLMHAQQYEPRLSLWRGSTRWRALDGKKLDLSQLTRQFLGAFFMRTHTSYASVMRANNNNIMYVCNSFYIHIWNYDFFSIFVFVVFARSCFHSELTIHVLVLVFDQCFHLKSGDKREITIVVFRAGFLYCVEREHKTNEISRNKAPLNTCQLSIQLPFLLLTDITWTAESMVAKFRSGRPLIVPHGLL